MGDFCVLRYLALPLFVIHTIDIFSNEPRSGVRVCGIESRCLVWLVLSLLAARGSHVFPVGAVVLHGFR